LTDEIDELVPDPRVARELGISLMGLWRRTHDPKQDFPPPVKVRNRNYRSRRLLEAYKQRLIKTAVKEQAARVAEHEAGRRRTRPLVPTGGILRGPGTPR
jgi:hypothetical protein